MRRRVEVRVDMTKMRVGLSAAIGLASLAAAAGAVAAAGLLAGRRPADVGQGGRLAPCRTSPNCVSSQATDPAHFVPPLSFAGTAPEAMSTLRRVLGSMDRVRVVRTDPDYIYAEFTSRLLGFVDDLEFALDPTASVIHVRSASRLGRSDFGVNRRRVEAIRARLASGA